MGSTTAPLDRPLLIFDGDCSFCRRWIERWKHLTGGQIDYEPYQSAAQRLPQVPRAEFGKSVYLVEPDGRITRAAEAVFRSLALAGQKRYLLWLYEKVPLFGDLTEDIYRLIARNRDPIDTLDRIIVGVETRPATYVLTRALFLRLLGVIYLIAFVSFFVQMDGLIGTNGVLPAQQFIDAVTNHFGGSKWWIAPTLAYYDSSDRFLHILAIAGIVCSCLLIVGVLPMVMSIALWATYLSLVTVGQVFLGYQWDALLLETGFLAILFSPLFWIGRRTVQPSPIALFMIRWLLFRLMFLSALVKLLADDCWRDMSALRYHFETQPLATWTSWHAHHSPQWMLAIGCVVMFFIEAVVPFLYFAPRRTRMLAFWLTVLLQVNIMLTGNYGFFNLLTIVLAISLLDDPALSRVLRMAPDLRQLRRPRLRPLVAPIALVIFVLSVMAAIDRIALINWPKPLAKVQEFAQRFHIANAYGLFAMMTRERPEIIIEGSDDGITWKPYEFKWKPGDVKSTPRFCEPHMPRLDWQMWFAALGPERHSTLLQNLAVRLWQRQPEVLDLLANNPFPDRPPQYIRMVLWNYRFSDPRTRRETGAWWTREEIRVLFRLDFRPRLSPTDATFRL
jgi:predicted DCC family thiol-disulfide oxidoreductase YuxK